MLALPSIAAAEQRAWLAITLRAQGDLAGARVRQDRVLEAMTRVLGAEHPDTLMAANSLANTLRAQGDLADKARRRNVGVLRAA